MALTAPVPISPAPEAPDRNDRPTFGDRTDAWLDWEEEELYPKANALAQGVYTNAQQAHVDSLAAQTAAAAADADALQTDSDRNAANNSAVQAGLSAGTASTKAGEAGASAVAAQAARDLAVPAAQQASTARDQAVQAAAQAGATLVATSTTALTASLAPQTLTVQANKALAPGQYINVALASNAAVVMRGLVTGYVPATGVLNFAPDTVQGSGTAGASWVVSVAAAGDVAGLMPATIGRPSLLRDYRNAQALGAWDVFTRASTKTRISGSGRLETLAIDRPAFDFDPVTVACLGLRMEPQGANFLRYSEDLTNAAWGNCARTLSAKTWRGVPLQKVAKQLTSTSEAISQEIRGAVGVGDVDTFEFSAMADTSDRLSFGILRAYADWSAASFSAVITEGPGQIAASGVGALYNLTGLSSTAATRVRVRRIAADSAAIAAYIYPDTTNSAVIGKSVFVGAVQAGGEAGSYIKTLGAPVTSAADGLIIPDLDSYVAGKALTVAVDYGPVVPRPGFPRILTLLGASEANRISIVANHLDGLGIDAACDTASSLNTGLDHILPPSQGGTILLAVDESGLRVNVGGAAAYFAWGAPGMPNLVGGRIAVGSVNGVDGPIQAAIARVRIWPRAFAAAELAAIVQS